VTDSDAFDVDTPSTSAQEVLDADYVEVTTGRSALAHRTTSSVR
jgi:hypothetical protein